MPGDPGSHGPFRDFREVFEENLDFSRINIYFWDFEVLSHVNAEAHARGFAPL